MLKPGKYPVKITNYGISDGKIAPQVMIEFMHQDGESITWYGSLSERASQQTLKALINCGLNTTEIADLAAGPASGALDMKTMVQITVEESTYNGKTRTKVKWINPLSSAKFEATMTKDEAKKKLGNFSGAIQALRAEMGVKPKDQAKVDPGF